MHYSEVSSLVPSLRSFPCAALLCRRWSSHIHRHSDPQPDLSFVLSSALRVSHGPTQLQQALTLRLQPAAFNFKPP